jgi:hypothetical protein
MKNFNIRRFAGIETRYDSADQDRGTLRRADGVVVAPAGTLSKGPYWRALWGSSLFAARIATALTGQASGTHFVSLRRGAVIILVAWDTAASRARGVWHVAGDDIAGDSTASFTATAELDAVGLTASAPWFGRWMGGRLLLGNGIDPNLIWDGSTLRRLGPTVSPTHDPADPSKFPFPPCTSFIMDADGRICAAGNAEAPLRIYVGERPNAVYQFNEGMLSDSRSSVDILTSEGTRVTALADVSGRIVAHLDRGGAIAVTNFGPSSSGYSAAQSPIACSAGAVNPNATHDDKGRGIYLGTDCELYEASARTGRDVAVARDSQILTNRSAGDWNSQASAGADTFTLFDDRSNRLWVNLALSTGCGLYCYDLRGFAVTGPFLYPDFICSSRVRSVAVRGVHAIAVTRGGAFLWTDLTEVGERSLSLSPGSPLYATSVPSTPCSVGISADGQQITQRIDGVNRLLTATEWAAGTSLATRWLPGAQAAIVDLATEDFGSPAGQKDFLEVRFQSAPLCPYYYGIEVDDGNTKYFTWYDRLVTWKDERATIQASGLHIKVRLVLVYFSDQPFSLSSISLGFLEAPER